MNDAERRVAERLAMAEGVAPPSLAREQERTGQRREALAALAGVLARLLEAASCSACGPECPNGGTVHEGLVERRGPGLWRWTGESAPLAGDLPW